MCLASHRPPIALAYRKHHTSRPPIHRVRRRSVPAGGAVHRERCHEQRGGSWASASQPTACRPVATTGLAIGALVNNLW